MQIHFEYTGFEQQIQIDGSCFVPKIYDGEGDPPEGFNAVRICLDASDRSALHWQEALLKAQYHGAQGRLMLWDLQMDLLEGSLEDDARFMTLQLGVQHFVEVIWSLFKDQTLGVTLYRGPFNEQVKKSMIGYLKLLAALLPEEAPCFLFLDTTPVVDPAPYFRLLSLESFGHLRLVTKGPCAERFPYALPTCAWDHRASPLGFCSDAPGPVLPQRRIEYAICLPETSGDTCIENAIAALGEIPFRVIPEALLTQEWDGIEKLIIFPEWLDERGMRKVRGFVAAGGEVINMNLQVVQMA